MRNEQPINLIKMYRFVRPMSATLHHTYKIVRINKHSEIKSYQEEFFFICHQIIMSPSIRNPLSMKEKILHSENSV